MTRLAIMDWGIGGLGCWREWKRRPLGGRVLYFSDSGYTPYGKVPAPELASRVLSVISWMKNEMDVSHVIVACNAASTVIGRLRPTAVQSSGRLPDVMGIIRPAVELVRSAVPANELLAVVGGRRTIRSGIYARLLKGRAMRQRIAQPLSALVEAGRLDGSEVEGAVSQVLRPLQDCRHLLLACTHYAALSPVFSRLRPDMKIWDPVPHLVSQALSDWGASLNKRFARGDSFITTGSPSEMADSACKAFGLFLTADHVRI